MSKHKTIDSKEMGLGIYLILGQYFLKTDHLHFGYWPGDLEVDISNFPQAQDNYCNFLISHIPEGTKTILDVGCGTGRFALKLMTMGYRVDCVSPSPLLSEYARKILGKNTHIFECNYEQFQTRNKYGLILFSESFQYVDQEKALPNTLKFLPDGGHLLICDYFKTNAKGKSPLGGGHELTKFYDLISQYPFKLIKNIDITKETSPNLEIADDLLTNVGLPIWNLVFNYLSGSYPFLFKLLQWKYREKIRNLKRKYFSGERNVDNFAIFKSYRLLLYRKMNSDDHGPLPNRIEPG